MVSKLTWIITNIPGPQQPVVINGKKSLKMQVVLPGLADISGGFALVSHQDNMKISFMVDDSKCTYEQAKRVLEVFEKTFDAFLASKLSK